MFVRLLLLNIIGSMSGSDFRKHIFSDTKSALDCDEWVNHQGPRHWKTKLDISILI